MSGVVPPMAFRRTIQQQQVPSNGTVGGGQYLQSLLKQLFLHSLFTSSFHSFIRMAPVKLVGMMIDSFLQPGKGCIEPYNISTSIKFVEIFVIFSLFVLSSFEIQAFAGMGCTDSFSTVPFVDGGNTKYIKFA